MSLQSHVSSDPFTSAAEHIVTILERHLTKGMSVLWLLSGGSTITVAVKVATMLASYDVAKITLMLTDERYGEVGHVNSNWAQLVTAGFVLPGARMAPTLNGGTFDETTRSYDEYLMAALQDNDFCIGLFGIGADGHTAGILPESPAVTSPKFAVGYAAAPYERITMTGTAIAQLNSAVLVGAGESKWLQFDQLQTDVAPLQQPVQLLKTVPELEIYRDNKENV